MLHTPGTDGSRGTSPEPAARPVATRPSGRRFGALATRLGVWAGVAAALAGGLVAGCGPRDGTQSARAAAEDGVLRVVVTVPPLEGLVRALLPAEAQVVSLIPPGTSEHGFEPTVREVRTLAAADTLIAIGLGLDTALTNLVRQGRLGVPVVRCDALLGLASAGDDDHGHAHGHGHDHGHDEAPSEGADAAALLARDPHVWLDPVLVGELLPALAAALPDPDGGRAARLARAVEMAAEVDAAYRAGLAPFAGRSIVTHHHAWGRLAARYGLGVAAVVRPIETAEPTPDELSSAVEAARRAGAGVLFVEPQFNDRAAARVAEATGLAVERLDVLGQGDWRGMMLSNLEVLERALRRTQAAGVEAGAGASP